MPRTSRTDSDMSYRRARIIFIFLSLKRYRAHSARNDNRFSITPYKTYLRRARRATLIS